MLIKLELEVTPKQLTGIGQVLSGHIPVVLDTPLTRCTMSESIAAIADPDIERTDHIEATIPVSQGGTKIEQSAYDAFDKHWNLKITLGAADEIGSAEYTRSFVEWYNNGCPELFEQPDSPAADAQPSPEEEQIAEADSPAAEFIRAQERDKAALKAAGYIELAKGTNGQMIPWDARIHGKAKNKNADGSWRLLQGVDRDAFVPQVEAELVTALTAPKSAEGVSVPSPEQSPAVVTTTAPAAAPTVPSPPSDKPTTFPELLPLVTAAKAAGTLTDETIANACAELGLATFGLIATRPDLIPQAAELLGV